jgi:cobalt-zinc-cadmium efflux system membrane fusion protein
MPKLYRPLSCLSLAWLAACSQAPEPAHEASQGKAHSSEHAKEEHGDAHDTHEPDADHVQLSDSQIAAAGIEVAPVRRAFAGSIDAPAVIAANPARSSVVAVAIGGRILALHRNLGEPVARGDALAVIESREVAELKAELQAARRHHELAQATWQREERLYREKVSAEQDYLAARTGAQEAQIRVRLAEQRLAAAGGGGDGPLNRLTVRSPLKGKVIARQAALGDVVASNTELFRVADLSEVSVELALAPDAASRVRTGAAVTVSTPGRSGTGRVVFVSPVIDPETRQVRAMAALPNADGIWRIGETVTASIATGSAGGPASLAVPQTAVQTVEDKPSVFVRTKDGFAVKHLVLGRPSGGYVAVVSGLSGDERVAVTNSYVLKAELGKGEGGEHVH